MGGEQDELTARVLSAVFEVSNTLGAGFLEKVYERALMRELALRGIEAKQQACVKVFYKDEEVGSFFPDIVVEGRLLLELKCGSESFFNLCSSAFICGQILLA